MQLNWHKKEIYNKKAIIASFLAIIALFSFAKTYSMHIDNVFPYHHDEWQHLAISMSAIENNYNKNINPYFGTVRAHADLEPGFHLFLSELFILSGLDPVKSYSFLPALFAALSSIIIFYAIYSLTRDLHVSGMSSILFNFLPTNVNILGKDFFSPQSMTIPLMFIFAMLYIEALSKKSLAKAYFCLLFLIVIFLIYPPSFFILIIPMLIVAYMHKKMFLRIIARNKNKMLIILIPFFIAVFLMVWKGQLSLTFDYIKKLIVFSPGWGKLEIIYFLPLLYGLSNTICAVLGFSLIYKNEENNNLVFFLGLSVVSLFITSFFSIFQYTILIPYPRALHYAMVGMLPLSAFGIVYLLKKVKAMTSKDKAGIIAMIAALIIFFSFNFFPTYVLNEKYIRYMPSPVLNQSEYNALVYIKDNFGNDNIIVTPYFMTSAVYPVSRNKVISVIPAQLEGGDREDNFNFFNYDCVKKEEVIVKTNADLILSKQILSCPFLKEKYNRDGTYIYQVYQVN